MLLRAFLNRSNQTIVPPVTIHVVLLHYNIIYLGQFHLSLIHCSFGLPTFQHTRFRYKENQQ